MTGPADTPAPRQRRPTPEQIRDDWQFLTAWLRGEIPEATPLPRQWELLFCHHVCGLASSAESARPGWEAVARQKRNQLLFTLRAQALFETLANRCREQGVTVLPVKGISLTLTEYAADPGRRQLSDIDLLVLPDDLPRLATVLAGLGYEPKSPQMLEPAYQQHKRKAEFVPQAPGLPPIDVHTAFIVKKFLARHGGIPLATVFARARQVPGQQGTLSVLDPIDEWLYLAYHFCLHHRFAGLKWLDDLQQTRLRLSEDDGRVLLQRAQEAGLASVLSASLDLLDRVYGPAPRPWRQLRQQPLPRLTRIWLEDALLPAKLMARDLEHGHGSLTDRLSASLWEFLFIDGRRARRSALRRLLFPSKPLLATIISPHPWPAYLLLAPLTTCATSLLLLAFLLTSLKRHRRVPTPALPATDDP